VIDFAHQALLGRLHTAAEAHDPPLAALRAVFMAHVGFVVEQPGVPRVIFQELQHPEDTPLKARVRMMMQAYRALITGLLQRAQAARRCCSSARCRGW
jgi:TetR/AcrR family transcriptional regulator